MNKKIFFWLIAILIIGILFLVTGFGFKKTFTSEKYGMQIEVPITWSVAEATKNDYPNVLEAQPYLFSLYNLFAFWVGGSITESILVYPDDTKYPIKNIDDLKKNVEALRKISHQDTGIEIRNINGIDYIWERYENPELHKIREISYFITPLGIYQYMGDLKELNFRLVQ